MKQQGAIILGSGGDCCATNNNLSQGTFCEGATPPALPTTRCRPTSTPPDTSNGENSYGDLIWR